MRGTAVLGTGLWGTALFGTGPWGTALFGTVFSRVQPYLGQCLGGYICIRDRAVGYSPIWDRAMGYSPIWDSV